ncbi:MAG: acyl-CoA dehydrogenase family protein [Gemmatimonadota bacterium]
MTHLSGQPVVVPAAELLARARTIGATIASQCAGDVDLAGRFPVETIAAMREAALLSALVPAEHGGSGASMRDLVAMCSAVAQGCASSGMILAMHHIQVACLVRHARHDANFAAYLDEMVERQLLLASITSEVGTNGDTRSSVCAVERTDGRFALTKQATTVSYGDHADDLLVTCRRTADAPASDQVLVLCRGGDTTLERTGEWNTLGMRGTCSPPFRMTSRGPSWAIVPGSFADSSAQSMVPYSHILWSAVWLGLASDAAARAAAYVRAEARRKPGTTPPMAMRLAELSVQLQTFRQNVAAVATDFDALQGDREPLSGMPWALRLNNLKIASSTAVTEIVHLALQVIGITGYRNDTPYSVGRQYRDALSASLMVNNDRILAKGASMLLVLKDE